MNSASANMNEDKIRQLIRQEIAAQASGSRFGLTPITRHTHNNVDSPPINQANIVPNTRVEGSFTMSSAKVYKFGINFNPTAVYAHGNVVDSISGNKFITVGNAQLGPSYYAQPGTTSSTIVGGPKQNVIQSCTYLGVELGGTFGTLHTLVDEGHIVDIFYSSTVFARATITGFDSSGIYVQVDTLASGWSINLSLTVV